MRRGFTLVELSIILIIIGLLSGGILAAQSMISTVRTHRAVEQLQSYNILIEQFKIRYNTFPGDSPTFYPGANNNGIIEDANGNSGVNAEFSGEVAHVWTSLETAGMISTASSGNKNISFAKLDITKLEPAAASQFSSEINGTFKTTGNIINAPRYLGTGDDEIGVLITGIRGSKGSFLIADFSKVTPDNKTLTLAEGGVPKIQLERLEKKSLTIDPASLDLEAPSDPLAPEENNGENNNDQGNNNQQNTTCGNGLCDMGEEMDCPSDCWQDGYGNNDPGNYCPSGRYWDYNQNTCSCKEQHIPNGEECIPDCQGDAHWDESEQKCVSKQDGGDDSGGENNNSSSPVCGDGICDQTEHSMCSDCGWCGNGACDPGEQASCPNDCITCGNGICDAGEDCPQDCGCPGSGQYYDPTSGCICPQGQSWNGSSCIQQQNCTGTNEVSDPNSGQCVCGEGYTMRNGACAPEQCERYYYDYLLEAWCTQTGGSFNTCDTPKCTCPEGKYLSSDVCVPEESRCANIGNGTVWNGSECVCPGEGGAYNPYQGIQCNNEQHQGCSGSEYDCKPCETYNTTTCGCESTCTGPGKVCVADICICDKDSLLCGSGECLNAANCKFFCQMPDTASCTCGASICPSGSQCREIGADHPDAAFLDPQSRCSCMSPSETMCNNSCVSNVCTDPNQEFKMDICGCGPKTCPNPNEVVCNGTCHDTTCGGDGRWVQADCQCVPDQQCNLATEEECGYACCQRDYQYCDPVENRCRENFENGYEPVDCRFTDSGVSGGGEQCGGGCCNTGSHCFEGRCYTPNN